MDRVVARDLVVGETHIMGIGFRMRIAAAFAILAFLVPVTSADGGEKWCEEDPVLTIDGRTVDYTTSFPLSAAAGARMDWTFHIPVNVLTASAITPPAAGSPAVASTVTIVRDQPAYSLLASAAVVTTVRVSTATNVSTVTAVKGTNAAWTSYTGKSNRALTFQTTYQAGAALP
ncbi:MAG TPA: hypothetical protein VM070_05435 [Candidatus Saccharimonadales bacterium]|nr:hypothetical protein [Candidatus Saccharimonadales bacterium]